MESEDQHKYTPPLMSLRAPLPSGPIGPSAEPMISLDDLEMAMANEEEAAPFDGRVSEVAAQQRRARRNAAAKATLADGTHDDYYETEPEPRYLFKSRHGRILKGGGGGGSSADVPVAWANPAFGSFDDFWSSMLLLFVAATADGWDMFMFTGMDAVGPNISPVRNDFSPLSMFFILWLVLGCFTMMNLFVVCVLGLPTHRAVAARR